MGDGPLFPFWIPASSNQGSRRFGRPRPQARPSLVAGFSPRLRASARGDGQPPAQVVVEAPRLLQLLHALDAQEARACECLRAHAVPAVGVAKLFGAAAHGPLRPRLGQHPRKLGAIHLVGALVRTAALGERNPRARHYLRHGRGHLADAVVLAARADVEGLIVHELARSLEHGEERAGDVLDMDERPPRSPVALHDDLAPRVRPPDEVVHDYVEPQPWRHPVGRGVAEVRRAEVVISELGDVALGHDLGLPVGRDRREGRTFVEHRVVLALAVETARGREEKARHARLFGLLRDVHRGEMVDVVRRLRVEVADGVVADGGQMGDGVAPGEVRGRDVAHVGRQRRDLRRRVAEDARREQIEVKAYDVVAGSLEKGDEDRAYVAVVAYDEYAQGKPPDGVWSGPPRTLRAWRRAP